MHLSDELMSAFASTFELLRVITAQRLYGYCYRRKIPTMGRHWVCVDNDAVRSRPQIFLEHNRCHRLVTGQHRFSTIAQRLTSFV